MSAKTEIKLTVIGPDRKSIYKVETNAWDLTMDEMEMLLAGLMYASGHDSIGRKLTGSLYEEEP